MDRRVKTYNGFKLTSTCIAPVPKLVVLGNSMRSKIWSRITNADRRVKAFMMMMKDNARIQNMNVLVFE